MAFHVCQYLLYDFKSVCILNLACKGIYTHSLEAGQDDIYNCTYVVGK